MAPTRVRARVLAFAFFLAVVTYLDRICISAAAPYIMRDLQLTVLQMSVVFSAFMLCGTLVFAATLPVPAVAKAVLLALALASADLALGACWAVPVDVAPDHAGVVTGFMNTLGNLGGLIGPLVVGVAVDRWHSWTFPFYMTAAIYVCGGIAWLAIDPGRPIAPAVNEARSLRATAYSNRI